MEVVRVVRMVKVWKEKDLGKAEVVGMTEVVCIVEVVRKMGEMDAVVTLRSAAVVLTRDAAE